MLIMTAQPACKKQFCTAISPVIFMGFAILFSRTEYSLCPLSFKTLLSFPGITRFGVFLTSSLRRPVEFFLSGRFVFKTHNRIFI
jgi:hypothetical protein